MLRPWLKFWKTTPLWRNTLRKISELKLIVLRQETRWEWLGLAMSHFSSTGLGCERLHRLLPTVPPPPPPHRWCGRSPPPGRHHPSRQVIISASLFSLSGILSHIFSHIYVSHISCYQPKLVRFRDQYPPDDINKWNNSTESDNLVFLVWFILISTLVKNKLD